MEPKSNRAHKDKIHKYLVESADNVIREHNYKKQRTTPCGLSFNEMMKEFK